MWTRNACTLALLSFLSRRADPTPPCTLTFPSAMHFSTKTNKSLCGRQLDFGVLGTLNFEPGLLVSQPAPPPIDVLNRRGIGF
eukprot:COSAG03_NODE_1830_length_3461_cov_4.027365_6_plen_83_part_00